MPFPRRAVDFRCLRPCRERAASRAAGRCRCRCRAAIAVPLRRRRRRQTSRRSWSSCRNRCRERQGKRRPSSRKPVTARTRRRRGVNLMALVSRLSRIWRSTVGLAMTWGAAASASNASVNPRARGACIAVDAVRGARDIEIERFDLVFASRSARLPAWPRESCDDVEGVRRAVMDVGRISQITFAAHFSEPFVAHDFRGGRDRGRMVS